MNRTHNNGELRLEHVGQVVELKGWVAKTRNLGGLVFIDLRDRYGITQLVANPENVSHEVLEAANKVRNEYVIAVKGTVAERQSKNPNMATGDIEIILDEVVKSKEDVLKLNINNGDIVCFDPRVKITDSGYIKSRFLDDKYSCGILLGLAKYLKDNNITLNRHISLHFTVYEEVGHGASASVPADTNEILSVDMGCVGNGLVCDEQMVSICAKDSAGPYNYQMVDKLIHLAKENDLNYAIDVYPYYSSDAQMAVRSGHDVKHALIGPGVYASHGYERSHRDGALNTLKLLIAYVKE